MPNLSLRPTDEDAGSRLDVYIAKEASFSRAHAGSLVEEGLVTVNGAAQRKAYKVVEGDVIEVAERVVTDRVPPSGVEVVYEDDHLLVVNKSAGVVVHAAPGVREGTMVDALEAEGRVLAARGGEGRHGVVHRLDRDVSGLLVVAKTDLAHERLVEAMKARDIERRYNALVVGSPETDRGKIDAPVGRDPNHRTRMAVIPEGKSAVTWFSVEHRYRHCSLLDVRLETGRTHQIRIHLSSIGHPIVGDTPYGRDPALARGLGLTRPFLHAYRLAFAHPVTQDGPEDREGGMMEFAAALPDDLTRVLEKVER